MFKAKRFKTKVFRKCLIFMFHDFALVSHHHHHHHLHLLRTFSIISLGCPRVFPSSRTAFSGEAWPAIRGLRRCQWTLGLYDICNVRACVDMFYVHVCIFIYNLFTYIYIHIYILVGGLEHFLLPHILGIIIPID